MEQNGIAKIEKLNELELAVLKRCAARQFFPDDNPVEEQDAYIHLLDLASAYESNNDLIDERLDFTSDCNLLIWFWHRYAEQEGLDESCTSKEMTPDEDGIVRISDTANE